MTHSAITTLAQTGLTSQSRLPVKKARVVLSALKLASTVANTSLPRPKPHAPSVRCPAPTASTSSQRKVSPSTVVVPSARQIDSIAKHLKRNQPVSKAHPNAVQQRPKPSQQSSFKIPLPSRTFSSPQSAHSMSARKAEKPTEDQVLEALCSLRVSSPVSTVPSIPGSRIPRRVVTPPQNPTTRPVLKSCLVKKNVVLSSKVQSNPCRPMKQVRFGISNSARYTLPEVHFYELGRKLEKNRWPHEGKLKKDANAPKGWVRWNDPVEVALPEGTVAFCYKMDALRVIRKGVANPCDLATFCTGPCRELRVRGGYPMPAWFARHPNPPSSFGRAALRCNLCVDPLTPRVCEKRGGFVMMEPADSSSWLINQPWALSMPLEEGDSPYDFDDDSDDEATFILDAEPLVNSVDVRKVTELVSTSAVEARSETYKCMDGSSDLPTILRRSPEPYDWGPDIF